MLNNIKTVRRDSGFTIVELLIVIVVIGILAAITIVAYNGIQSQAKATSAKASAGILQKKLEAYNADPGGYPAAATATTNLNSNEASTLAGSGISLGTPTNANGQKTLRLELCTAPAGATGYRITYWDYITNTLPAVTAAQVTGGTNSTACTTYTVAT